MSQRVIHYTALDRSWVRALLCEGDLAPPRQATFPDGQEGKISFVSNSVEECGYVASLITEDDVDRLAVSTAPRFADGTIWTCEHSGDPGLMAAAVAVLLDEEVGRNACRIGVFKQGA